MARDAAAQLVGMPVCTRPSGETPEGWPVFEVTCIVPSTKVTVTFNPNGRKATVEWRSGQIGVNYKIHNLDTDADDLTTTGESEAIP